MARPRCQEDDYEFRVRKIFKALREEYEECDECEDMSFLEWIDGGTANKAIADTFLEDVVSYMGIPEEEDDG